MGLLIITNIFVPYLHLHIHNTPFFYYEIYPRIDEEATYNELIHILLISILQIQIYISKFAVI
jgi:hypothetical protein